MTCPSDLPRPSRQLDRRRVRGLTAAVTLTAATAVTGSAFADSINWLGVTPTGNWSVAAQWQSLIVPGPDDVAVFPDYGGGWIASVDIDPSVAGLLMLDPFATVRVNSGRTLTILDDPADVNGFLALPTGTFNLAGGTVIVDDSINGGGGIDLDGELVATSSSTIDAADFDNTGGVLRIAGRPGISATLTLVEPFTNRGLFEFDTNSNGVATLGPLSAPVTNDAGATIRFLQNGSTPVRNFRTDLDSSGLVEVGDNAQVFFNEAGTTLRLSGGDLTIAPTGTLRNSSAAITFELDGGAVQNDGLFRLDGSTLSRLIDGPINGFPLVIANGDVEFPAGSTASGSLELQGAVDVVGDVPPNMVIDLLGVPGVSATMTSPGADILGELRMGTTSNGVATLVSDGQMFVAGTLRTLGGGSTPVRQLSADIDSDGTVVIGSGTQTSFLVSGTTLSTRGSFTIEPGGEFRGSAGTTFELDGGSFVGDGLFDWTNGTVHWLDGTIAGDPWFLSGCELLVDAAADGPADFVVDGTTGYTGDITSGRSVTVLGIPGITATTTLRSSMQLDGLLELESISNGLARLVPETAGVESVTIGSGGELRLSGGGSALSRDIDTEVINDGTVTIADGAQARFTAGTLFETRNTVTLGTGATMKNNSAPSTLRLVSGTISGEGQISWTGGGRIELAGGTVSTPAIDLGNGTLVFPPGSTAVASVLVWGTGPIEGDIPGTAVIRIEGRPGISSIRTLDEGAHLNGVVQMSSTSNGFAQLSGPVGTGTPVVNSGTIVTEAGGSQPGRTFNLDLRNEGLIRLGPGTANQQSGGAIVNAGLFVANAPYSRTGAGLMVSNEVGGTIAGSGPIGTSLTSVLSGGTTSPGDTGPGVLTINGDWEQTASGRLLIEYGGLIVGDDHDQLAVGDTAILAGALDLRPIDGFIPEIGDSFRILTAETVIGTFDTVTCAGNYQVIVDKLGVLVTVLGAPVPGDLNCDGIVGFADLLAVLAAYGPCDQCPEDLDGSGEVDFADILFVLAAFD